MRAAHRVVTPEVSPAQLAANRENAQHSTGPRTPEGKARVAQNAVKHGLFSRDHWKGAVLIDENPADFDALLEEMLHDCDPQDRCERDLVHRMAGLTWRLARVHRAMEDTIVYYRSVSEERAAQGVKAMSAGYAIRESETLSPLETHLSRELSRLQRDLAFSQRYRHAAQERAEDRAADREAERANPSHGKPRFDPQLFMAELALEEAQTELRLRRSVANLGADEDDDRDEDEADESEELEADSEANPTSYQQLSRKSGKQTQSEDVPEASTLDDRPSDLT